jgi:hypothetical protein
MLAVSQGDLWAISTPQGRRGFFYESWAGDAVQWERVRVSLDECPRLTPEFIAQEKAELPPPWFRQEYETSFEADSNALFDPADIEAAFDARVPERKLIW